MSFMHPSMCDLSTEINTFCAKLRPFRETIEEKEKLITYIGECVTYLHAQLIQDLLRKNKKIDDIDISTEKLRFLEHMDELQTSNRSWNCFKFGSESWGTSCGDSDVDMAISLNFRNNRFDKKFILKNLSQIISENDNNGNLRVQTLLNAKYPIIRIYHIKYNYIKIDISIADRFCLKRNKLICDLINYYENNMGLPIKKLIIFIKYWSKNRGINNSYKCYLNSFGFTLLIIKFIQCLLNKNKHIICWNKPISNLVFEFFQFYVFSYDITKHGVSIQLNPQKNMKYNNKYNNYHNIFERKHNEQSIMEIIDPVNNENNIAQNVGYYQFNHIKAEFIRSFECFKQFMTQKKPSQISLFNVLTEIPGNYWIDNDNDNDIDIDIKSNISDTNSNINNSLDIKSNVSDIDNAVIANHHENGDDIDNKSNISDTNSTDNNDDEIDDELHDIASTDTDSKSN